MLWPRRVWWLAGELPVGAVCARCAGCSRQLTSGGEAVTNRVPDALDSTDVHVQGASERADDAGAACDGADCDGAPCDGAACDGAADDASSVAEARLVTPSSGAPTSSYCSTCWREGERQRDATRLGLVTALASGVVCALGLPLLRPETGLAGHLFATWLAVILPLVGLALPFLRRGEVGAPRVWTLGRAGVVIEGAALVEELERAGVRCRVLWLPPLAYRSGVALVVGAALVAAVALAFAGLGHAWYHPQVWVLALGDTPLTFSVDGAVLARLDPVQPGAAQALSLRLANGVRHLSARDDAGRSVAEVMATVVPGREHLFAPGGADECFWLERTGYGRDMTHEAVPLRSAARFFTLDASVDGWLSGTPPPSASDRRSTGGILVLLRHSACPRAPEPVRAASAAGP